MKNLRNKELSRVNAEAAEIAQAIKDLTTTDDIFKTSYFTNLSTDYMLKSKRDVWNLEEWKEYLLKRLDKKTAKQIEEVSNKFDVIENAPEFESATIKIEWKKSSTWGANPRAEAEVIAEGCFKRYESGPISGCGYDKESTAFAEALNQSPSFIKLLYSKYAEQADKKPNEVLGYGAGYQMPRLEGGVGVSCYYEIFKNLGFTLNSIARGNKFEVYTITKNQ